MKNHKKTKIIAIANQKGGVGKTATTINLGAAFALKNFTVLIIDIDPQANASTGLGFSRNEDRPSSYNLFLENSILSDSILNTAIEKLKIIPASNDLSSVDFMLSSKNNRLFFLKESLNFDILKKEKIDIVLLDCPPSLNLLSLNALVAAQSILVPLQAEFFALEGLSQLLLSVRKVREKANKNLRIEGILLTMFDGRNKLACQVEHDARENLGALVFETKIPRNVRISEAPSYGKTIFEYDTLSKGAIAYRNLAEELIKLL